MQSPTGARTKASKFLINTGALADVAQASSLQVLRHLASTKLKVRTGRQRCLRYGNDAESGWRTVLQPSLNWPIFAAVNEPNPVTSAAPVFHSPSLYPLSDVRAGVSVRIKRVSASPEITSRLREMGFCEDQKIRLISRQSNLICQVCHARLGISSQLAEKILVEPLTGQQAA
jgi:Fe2+ transport system protein FeoA